MKTLSQLYFFLLTVLFSLSIIKVYAQNPSKVELYKITQVSPNAASLGKYGEYPVSLYTGTPNINIPLYDINVGRINIPVSLSYHAGGIKVEEIAPAVGLGWALNAGGVITRSVMGLPDELPYMGDTETFLEPALTVDGLLTRLNDNSQASNNNTYMKKILAGKIDGEPDVFYYNFGNFSGKFMYHQADHKFYSIPYSKLKIEFDNHPGNTTFTITDEKGIEYLFSATESSHRESDEGLSSPVDVTTSWYLTSINDPVTKKSVGFAYSPYSTSYDTMSSETHYAPFDYGAYYSVSPKQNSTNNLLRISTISFDSGSISFGYQMPRCDLPGDLALNSIKVYSSPNKLFKDYSLNYDYFYASGFTSTTNCNNAFESQNKRLKLLSVTENPVNGSTIPSKPYTFSYEDMPMPSRMSKAQDHWGYYNGKSNQVLYPSYLLHMNNGSNVSLPGADREVDEYYAKVAMLNKITYPTGGSTSFEFESNKTSSTSVPPATANGYAVWSGADGSSYTEIPFEINSPATCDKNGYNAGAYITGNMTGFDDVLIANSLGGNTVVTFTLVNLDTGTSELFNQYGGAKGGTQNMPFTFFLPNGHYKIIADCAGNPFTDTYMSAALTLNWIVCLPPSPPTLFNKVVGGLRIKKITNYTDAQTIASVKSYKYNIEGNPNYSSGQSNFYPLYFQTVMYSQSINAEPVYGSVPIYLKRTSSSNYPLVNESGKSVGYSNVIELNGDDDSNGYTQYQYTNYSEYDDIRSGSYPTSLPTSYQWLRGLEVEKKVFKKDGANNILVSKTTNEYDTNLLGTNKKTFNGIRGIFTSLTYARPLELPGEDMVFLGEAVPSTEVHPVYSDFVYLKRTRDTLYNGTSYVASVKEYTYNTRNFQPSITETLNSKGEKVIAHTTYPLDYTVAGTIDAKAKGIKFLQDMNYITAPVEQYVEKQVGTADKKLLGGTYNSYMSERPLVDTIFSLIVPPGGINNYMPISITASGIQRNPNYTPEVIVEKYDDFTNSIHQQKRQNGPSHAYIWNSDETAPMAEVNGAGYNDIAYTSFEGIAKGNWNYAGTPVADATAYTGRMVYTLSSGVISKNDLNSSIQYMLTYWVKGSGISSISGAPANAVQTSNGWTQYQRIVSGVTSINITGTETVDDIRIYPKEAQMTTYTFDPLVGMTSSTDAKGQTTYYEYDSFQRLKTIKDQHGNVVKQMDYHYQNQ